MPAHTASLLPAAVAALALGLPAAPAVAATTCQPGQQQKVVARSARAVLLTAADTQRRYRLWACSRRTGARRLLATGGEGRHLVSPMLRGTHVGYVDAGLHAASSSTVVSDDAVRRGRRVAVGEVRTQEGFGLRMGDDGALAWRDMTPPGMRLWLWRPSDTTRLVDEGFHLTSLRFTGRTLRWRHTGVDRSAPPPTASACAGRPGAGSTTTVDIIHTTLVTVACWRATGASATFEAKPASLATTGAWVAAETRDTIEVRNLLAPAAARSVPWGGQVAGLLVDEHGSLAWTFSWNGSGHPPRPYSALWVVDGTGTRALGSAWLWDDVTLGRDGSTLRWRVRTGTGDTFGETTMAPRSGT